MAPLGAPLAGPTPPPPTGPRGAWPRATACATRPTEVEHWADEVTHQVMAALNRTFVTPLDREDIAGLANALDDVIDLMDVALRRMVLFKLRTASPAAQALAHTVLAQVEAID